MMRLLVLGATLGDGAVAVDGLMSDLLVDPRVNMEADPSCRMRIGA